MTDKNHQSSSYRDSVHMSSQLVNYLGSVQAKNTKILKYSFTIINSFAVTIFKHTIKLITS